MQVWPTSLEETLSFFCAEKVDPTEIHNLYPSCWIWPTEPDIHSSTLWWPGPARTQRHVLFRGQRCFPNSRWERTRTCTGAPESVDPVTRPWCWARTLIRWILDWNYCLMEYGLCKNETHTGLQIEPAGIRPRNCYCVKCSHLCIDGVCRISKRTPWKFCVRTTSKSDLL